MAAALSLASAPDQQIFYFLVALLSPVDGLGKCGWRMNRRADFLRRIFNARQARACDNETFGMTEPGHYRLTCADAQPANDSGTIVYIAAKRLRRKIGTEGFWLRLLIASWHQEPNTP